MDNIPDFSGPFGGVVAGAFFSGCAAGYAFAKRTLLKMANKEIKRLTQKVDDFKKELVEQDEKCESRMRDLEKRHDKKMKWIEDRLVKVEESRLKIALGGLNANNNADS